MVESYCSISRASCSARLPAEDFTVVLGNGDTISSTTEDVVEEPAINVSSQSVEIITHEESQLVKLEDAGSVATAAGARHLVQESRDADRETIESPDSAAGLLTDAYVTAEFYIEESLPSSPMTDSLSCRQKVCPTVVH